MLRFPTSGRHPSVALGRQRKVISLLILTILLLAGLGTIAVAQPTDCTNLVTDSGLESGAGWSANGGSYSLLSNFLVHSGAKAAHLAGVDNASDSLTTALTLPADRPSVTLNFWWQINSEEESNEFDGLSVLISDTAGNVLRSLAAMGSDSAAHQWQNQSLDLSDFVGQSIQLKFAAQTDTTLVTDFFVDDVTVSACNANQGFRLFLPVTKRSE